MDKESPQKTVVIFGVSSFIGSNLAEIFSADYKVIGTYFRNPVSIPDVLTLPCNIINKEEVLMVLFAFRPDIALYCVGTSSLLESARDEAEINTINTAGVFNVIEGCQRYHAQICYISSNYVFSGKNIIYRETDTPEPNTIYGKNHSMIEFYLQKSGLNYTIFRVSKVYGIGINPYRLNWFEYLQKMFGMNASVNCDDYIHLGFIDIHYLATVLKLCFNENATNRLFQISSSDTCTHYEFAQSYCDIFDDSDSLTLLQKGNWHFPYMDDGSIPKDGHLHYALNLSNIESFLGIKMPSVRESMEFSKKKGLVSSQRAEIRINSDR